MNKIYRVVVGAQVMVHSDAREIDPDHRCRTFSKTPQFLQHGTHVTIRPLTIILRIFMAPRANGLQVSKTANRVLDF